jgi:hypothetical protein
MRRPNYRFERSERDRTKQAKKEEKLRRQQERVSQRDPDAAEEPAPVPPDSSGQQGLSDPRPL